MKKTYVITLERENAYKYQVAVESYDALMETAKEAHEMDLIMTWTEEVR